MNPKIFPFLLIYARLVLGFAILGFSVLRIEHYKFVAITCLTIGLMTDIFDGIIARRLQVSTKKLRRLDSTVDQVFFCCVALATYFQCPDFFKANSLKMSLLLGIEALAYLVCFLKFRKEIATHSIGAKIWTLLLFGALVQIILQCQSGILFDLCFWVGLITRIEIIAIVLILKTWTNDVPTVFHSVKLRQGKEIKRHRWFNG